MGRNRARRRASLSLVFTSAVVLGSLALVGEARAENHYGRLGFFPGRLKVNSDPTQCGVATYCGGPVLSNVQLVTVFWTNQVDSQTTQWAQGYAQAIVGSEALDMLSEYSTKGQAGVACGMQTPDAGIQYFGPPTAFSTGQTITRGSATQAYTITPALQMDPIVDDNGAIGLELASQIAAGNLPKPQYDAQGYPDTLYMVYFPASVNISLQGMQSCGAFGGYHYSASYTASGCKGQYIPYAVIPDCGYEGANLSDVVSHELSEAITDTDVGLTTPASANYGDGAWYLGPTNPCNNQNNGNNCPQNCGEVGDVCENMQGGQIPGSSIESQRIWSKVQNCCALKNHSIGTQTGPAPVSVCTSGSGSGGGSGSSSGSSSGGGSGSSSGSGSGAGSGSGGGSGSSSGSSSSSGGSGSGGVDASAPFEDAGSGDGGGNGVVEPPGGSSGCGCDVVGGGSSSGFAALAGLLALTLLGRSRRR